MNIPIFHLHIRKQPKRFPRGPVQRLPARVWQAYFDALKIHVIAPWRKVTEKLIIDRLPYFERQVEMERPGGMRVDSWPDELSKNLDELSAQYNIISEQSQAIASSAFEAVNSASHKQWYDIAKRVLGVDLFSYEPWIASESKVFVHVNTDLITNLQGSTQSDISRIVMGGFREGKRWETIRDEIYGSTDLGPGVFNKVETRAELIARDQTLKLYGALGQKRQQNSGLTLYTWRSMEDSRVAGSPGKYIDSRPSHACMDGKICSWDKPSLYANSVDEAIAGKWKDRESMPKGPGQDGEPGQNRPNCRCYGEPVFQTLFL